MPKKPKKQAESRPAQELAEKLDLPTADQIGDPNLPSFAEKEEKPFEVVPYPHHAEIKTSKGFVGRIASGRGRVVEAHDADYSIEAFKNPLTGPEVALAQRNGFDVMSEDGEAVTLMAGEKRAIREAGGDVNHVARVMVNRDAGRSR